MNSSSPLVQRLSGNVRSRKAYPLNFLGRLLLFLEHHPDSDHGDPEWLAEIVEMLWRFSSGETIGLTDWARETLPSHNDMRRDWRALHNYLSVSRHENTAPSDILNDLLTCARTACLSQNARQLLR
jgi:hypothetical protein